MLSPWILISLFIVEDHILSIFAEIQILSTKRNELSFSTAVNNGEGGYIRGAELAFTKVFDFLPEIWSGLGVQGSYS